MSEIGIHHYRSCRKEWDTPTKLLSWWKEDYFDGDDSTVCFNYNRRYSPVVIELAEMIRADVKKVQELLNVQYNYSEKKK
ncbi:hypothetical protein DPMN_013644 [Dreissena polymorpha]|uniref:Uncharacterized protein n=1 Tax=Dreissena polymorpha TaxID=45954 RepID=A0A9D4N8A1_DREPO|nr:hypothetical protein DPMN_013644 [Dreissena polymorpha]